MAEKKPNISFDDGSQKATINGDPDRVIKWVPTDVNFVDRILGFQYWAENDLKTRITEMGISNTTDIDEYKQGSIQALGDEICQRIDEVFGAPVSLVAFEGVNPCSPIANGKLLFVNFFEALMPLIGSTIKDFDKARKKYIEAAKTSPAPMRGRSK